MSSMKLLAAAGAVVVLAMPAARAADLPPLPPPMYQRPIIQDFSGWYLRGDIGFSNQDVKRLSNVLDNAPGISVQRTGLGFDAAPLFGLGLGYQWNNWLRFDVTGEFRGNANFHALDIVSFTGCGGPCSTDEYRASKSEWLFLANAYVDLGTWWNLTPFVGAGIGTSRNKISSFLDVCTTCPGGGVALADDTAKWNFAWAVHAGIAYKVTPSVTVEFAYRYVSLGDALSGDIRTFNGINNVVNPLNFHDITSQDFKLGVRWMLWEPEPPLPPLMRKG
jgi:opacity protein-like surface antigen